MFLLRKTILSTLSEDRQACLAAKRFPAAENILLDGTDVPHTVSLLFAKFSKRGYREHVLSTK